MLNRLADLVRLRAYADLLVQPVGRAAAVSLADLEVGTHVSALVELARTDGTVRARIDGQPFELRLPFNTRAGDTVALRVAARDPQLRFVLEPAADPAPPNTSLSETARFITALLAESDKLPVATAAVAGPPLLDAPPQDSRAIAHALKNALSDSGMFYEAHQAQWVADDRPLAALLREPQARLAPLDEHMQSDAGSANAPQLKELPVHRDALTVVRQQLETLETHQMVWQGTLWPGQTIEWQVGEDPAQQHKPPAEREWQSHLRLSLPRLGGIDATLTVSSRGVRVNLNTASEDSAALLEENRHSLRAALDNAGVQPLGIAVNHVGA